MEQFQLNVKYGNKLLKISVSASSTLRELRALLYTETGVAPELQKIMHRGELKGDDMTLGALKVNKASKLMLVGTKLKDVMAVATAAETSKELEKDPSDIKRAELAKQLPPFWFWPPYSATLLDPFLESVATASMKKGDHMRVYSYIFSRVVKKASDPNGRAALGLESFSESDAKALPEVLQLLEDCSEWTQNAQEVESPEQCVNIMKEWKGKLDSLEVGKMMLVPGGWAGLNGSGSLIHIIQRVEEDSFDFITCNPSKGLDYHQQIANENDDTPPKHKYKTCLKIDRIPGNRIKDLGFWSVLFSMWMKDPPSEYHRVEVIYDVLLPWLSEKVAGEGGVEQSRLFAEVVLATNLEEGIDWRTKCRASSSSDSQAIWEAIRYVLRKRKLSVVQVKQLSYVIRKEMIMKCGEDLISRFASKHEGASNAVIAAHQIGLMPSPDEDMGTTGLDTFDTVLSILTSEKSSLIDRKGKVYDPKSLGKKLIGLYFSAGWCSPCHAFTHQLVRTYESLKKFNKNIEIVFVSSDHDQASYDKYLSEMPWLAVPFADADARRKLSSRGRVQGIPTLIFFNSDGTLLSKNGRKIIIEDPEGQAFPWAGANQVELKTVFPVLQHVVNHKGAKVSPQELRGKVVGLYFSASWCGPCKGFTPVLRNTYKLLKSQNKEFEIIFISSDRDAESFKAYFEEMPWLAVAFEERMDRAKLAQVFQVKGIPTLILFDAKGRLISGDGRKVISMDQQGEHFPWSNLSSLEEEAGLGDESSPILKQVDVKLLTLGLKQFAYRTNKEVRAGRLDSLVLRRVKEIIDTVHNLMSVVPKEEESGGLPERVNVDRIVELTKFPLGDMMVEGDGVPNVERFAGPAWKPQHPVVANLLQVPEKITSLREVLIALNFCDDACERMLQRASQSGTSSRTVLQIQVIALITTLFLETLPIPLPLDAPEEAKEKSIWHESYTKETQLLILSTIQKLALVFAAMWQGVEHPTRSFDAERSLVAMAMLALFDFVIRKPPSDESMLITYLLSEDGGYSISSTGCPNQRSVDEIIVHMELVNPVHNHARCFVSDYLTSLKRVARHSIFTFRQEEIIADDARPTFSIEILKYGSDIVFMRKLMSLHGVQFQPTPGQPELVDLMALFMGPESDLAKEAPEFGLMRDMAALYKFLVTMQTRESELFQRCAGRSEMKHWSRCLSSDDPLASTSNLVGWSSSISPLKWELANVRGQDMNMADVICRFGDRVLYFGEGPVVHSPANLSTIIEKPRPSEDDVLHASNLPTFGDTLRREETESLLSYLSVEYARIPLVLGFFATRERTTYLFNPQLRDVLRAVLFEGGSWVSFANSQTLIERIPIRRTNLQHEQWVRSRMMNAKLGEEPNVLGTPEGNLLNELHCSPAASLDHLLQMFHSIHNLRNSTVHSADASFTLFLMELTIDVQAYIANAIRQESMEAEKVANDPTYLWDVNYGSAKNLETLRKYYRLVSDYLQNDIAPILYRWKLEAGASGDRATLSVIHSYMALLWSQPLEFDRDTVVNLLGHIAYVRNKHGFGLRRGRSDLMWAAGDDDMSPRDRLLRFLQANGIDTRGMGDASLDEYVEMNKKGPLILRLRHQSVIVPPLHRIQDLEALPPADVPEYRLFALLQTHRRSLVNWMTEREGTEELDDALEEIMSIALDNPDFNHRGWEYKGDGWFEASQAQIKLDVQSAEIFWRNDVLKPIPDSMTQYLDFKTLWDKPQFQCGLVRRDENRHWINIMDIPYELQEWTPPTLDAQGAFAPVHTPTLPPAGEEPDKDDPGTISFLGIEYSRPFELYSDVPHPISGERWAMEFLRPILVDLYPNTPMTKMGYKLLLPKEQLKDTDNVCRMLGREITEKEPDKMTWKEVVIYRDPKVLHVFNLVSHGRRMWRSQVYSSDSRLSLQSLLPNEAIRKVGSQPLPEESRYSSGDFKQTRQQGPSLVIMHRNGEIGGLEYFVPSRLLQGIVPSVLLETFRMWQGEDGIIRGTPHVTSQWFSYKLEITFRNYPHSSSATVVRKPTQSAPHVLKSKTKSVDNTGLRRSIRSPKSLRLSARDPKEEDIVMVVSMGFSKEDAVRALRKCNNDVERAQDYLLDNSTKAERDTAEKGVTSDYSTVDTSQQQSVDATVALLESKGFPPAAARHACILFNCDIDLVSHWLREPSNQETIEGLELNSEATTTTSVNPLTHSIPKDVSSDRSADLYLASFLSSKPGGTLYQLGKLLNRIEDLSHILIWTSHGDLAGSVKLDELSTKIVIIELPRLKVKFQVRKTEEDEIRLYLLDQAGWFVSDRVMKDTLEKDLIPGVSFLRELLLGIENCLVLENQSGDFQLFVPNHDCYRPQSKTDPFTTQLIYDRGSLDWQQVMESRYYLYPVHTSNTFLVTPTLGSALYLALLRFLNRDYRDCFQILETCYVDTPFTAEELHIFNQFAHGQDDCHPDAHACRLKMSLAVLFSDNKVPWQVHAEMAGYLSKISHVSAGCVLSPQEELDVLTNCQRNFPELGNRLNYLTAAIACREDNSKPTTVGLTVPPERLAGQPWLKLTSYSREYMDAQGQAITRVQYDPPGENLTDAGLFELLWEEKYISGEDSGPLGFIWLYELIKGSFKVSLLGQEIGTTLGVLLTRYMQLKSAHWGREALQEGERQYEGAWSMVELAAVMNAAGDQWPKLPDDQRSKEVMRMGINIGRLDRQTQGRLKLKSEFLDVLHNSTRAYMAQERYRSCLDNLTKMLSATRDDAKARSGEVSVLPEFRRWGTKSRPQTRDTGCNSHSLGPLKALAMDKFGGVPLVVAPEDIKSFSQQPLQVIALERYITWVAAIPATLDSIPFDVSSHPTAQSLVAKDMLKRVNADVKQYSDQTKTTTVPRLIGLLEEDFVGDNLESEEHIEKVITLLDGLIADLRSLHKRDSEYVSEAISRINFLSNYVHIPDDISKNATERCQFVLDQYANQKAKLNVNHIASAFLDKAGLKNLSGINPYMENSNDLIPIMASVMFYTSRVNQTNMALDRAESTKSFLIKLRDRIQQSEFSLSLSSSASVRRGVKTDLLEKLRFSSVGLAETLTCARHYVQLNSDGTIAFHPCFLIFEYIFSIMLRQRQVEMVNSFLTSISEGNSRVQQMIMGAGKTTVVGPLLTLMLSDGNQLVTQVMPTALLEQSRNILRSRFSAIVVKRIYTLSFERAVEDSTELVERIFTKLDSARRNRDVIVAAPECIKSLLLKFVEQLHSIEIFSNAESTFKPGKNERANRELMQLHKQMVSKSDMADFIVKILQMWTDGVLIMDEVDVLLHPLKSELNFPIGFKEAIDLAGVRWDLPIHLIDAIFYYNRGTLTSDLDSFALAEAKLGWRVDTLLAAIVETIDNGYKVHSLQRNPHIVLLDNNWYDKCLRVHVARWAVLWLYGKLDRDRDSVSKEILLEYIQGINVSSHTPIIEEQLFPDSIKLLNLTSDWIRSLFPHCLSKINRVAYGLLSPDDIACADPRTPQSRLVLAVPFVGKDVPSRSSEFAHPDALIGLTVMAYRYEGVRIDDLSKVVTQLKQDYSRQVGPREERPASVLFQKWLSIAQSMRAKAGCEDEGGNILPLSLFQPGDKKQLRALFMLVRDLPDLIIYYLRQHVFPACMNFQATKVSACGHELGSDILFSKRIGFSGTPSNLLPKDLGDCEYEPGSDGKIINTLTSTKVTSFSYLPTDWNAKKLLRKIATEPQPFHALIDTGALITGMDNQEVAHYLLLHLPKWFEGVVYLDKQDRQMILLRNSGRSMLLSQCGVRADRRFTFYDQVHTTGMDIKQAPSAKAIITLGKDMTFRDFAQGAYRMRGIGQGQTVHLYIIPEVRNLMKEELGTKVNTQHTEDTLMDVPSWLFVNSMRMETLQYVKLSSQELYNVWRKRALNEMESEVKEHAWVLAERGGTRLGRFRNPETSQLLTECIALFREPLGFVIPDKVPTREYFHSKLNELASQYKIFVHGYPKLSDRVDEILKDISTVELQEIELDKQNRDAHVVREQEQEAQEEAEEEAEQEEERESKFSREDEQPNPWEVRLLSLKPSLKRGQEAFYPFFEFQVRKEQPILPFPERLLLSDNFFRPSWISTGDRRLKTVTFVMEWIPELPESSEDQESSAKEAHIIRYFCALSLAEGETIRKVIHIRHPVLNNCAIALRSLEGGIIDQSSLFWPEPEVSPSEETTTTTTPETTTTTTTEATTTTTPETTTTTTPETTATDPSTALTVPTAPLRKHQFTKLCTEALKFVNCEMYYKDDELEILEQALAGAPLEARKEFFLDCLRLRRHERNVWDDTPLAKIFTPQDEWHMIRARAILQQVTVAINRTIKTRKKPKPWWNPYDIFKAYDADADGCLNRDELIHAFEEMKLEFSPQDYYEISKLIPQTDRGLYSMSAWATTLNLKTNAQIEEILVGKVFKATDNTENETWTCKVCSYAFNPKWVVVCDACQYNILGDPVVDLKEDEWACGKCSLRNNKREWFCTACWNARPSRFSL